MFLIRHLPDELVVESEKKNIKYVNLFLIQSHLNILQTDKLKEILVLLSVSQEGHLKVSEWIRDREYICEVHKFWVKFFF